MARALQAAELPLTGLPPSWRASTACTGLHPSSAHHAEAPAPADPAACAPTRAPRAQEYADEQADIPRPANWGGFLVRPHAIEFWHGRPSRLHDRLRFSARAGGGWDMQRLWP